jgi:Holliday junction resolvase RusA-like endonuclease
MRQFTLELPPTSNQLYRTVHRGGRTYQYMTGEARAWKEAAQWGMRDGRYKIIEGPVEVVATFYLKHDRDVDNLKILLDSLEGIVLKNDRQVEALHIFKEKDKEEPRVELEVYELEE